LNTFIQSLGMLSLLLAAITRPLQQDQPLPVEEYWQLVEQTTQSLETVDTDDPAAVRAQLDGLAARWEDVDSVRLPDGNIVAIDTEALVDAMQADPPDVAALGQQFRALLDAHEDWAQYAPGVTAEQATLDEILARPEFQWGSEETKPNPIQEFLDNLLRRFWDLLNRLIPGNVPIGGGVPNVVLFFVALLLAGILAMALRGMLRDAVNEADLEELEEGGELLTADTALLRAQETAQTGDYRLAVRYLYLSTLLQLEERGLLRYDRARTNREYLRSVAHRADLAAILRDVVDVFDRTWYGFQILDAETYHQYERRVGELRRLRQ
jgi:hypothetical protein